MDETPELLRQRIAWQCGQLVALEAAFAFLYKATADLRKYDHLLDPKDADLETLDRYFQVRLESIQSPDPEKTKRAARQGLDRLLRELSRQKSDGPFQAMAPLLALLDNDRDDAEAPPYRRRLPHPARKAAAAKRAASRIRAGRQAPPKTD